MIKPFSWSDNAWKLDRARVEAGPDASEAGIKEVYVRLGGKLIEPYEIPEVKEVSAKKPARKTAKK